MTLANYGGLKDAVSDWLARSDLSGRVPSFIRLAEADLNGRLRLRLMEVETAITIEAEATPLPADFLALRRVVVGHATLRSLTPHARRQQNRGVGLPRAYAIEGCSLVVAPLPDAPYAGSLLYVAALATLTGDADANAVLGAHPDLYLYGALIHAAPFIGDDDRVPVWRAQYEAALQRAIGADRTERRSGSPLMVQGGPAI